MSKNECVAVLDIGTAKTVAFVMELGSRAKPFVRGAGLSATLGLHKGKVADGEALAFSLRGALAQAEQNADCKISKLFCNPAGVSVKTLLNRGTTAIQQKTKEICAPDVERVVEASKILPVNSGQEVVHAVPQRFYIDERPCQQVLGEHGVRLEVETRIIAADAQQLADLTGIVNGPGFGPLTGWIHNGLALAGSVLTEEEQNASALVMDMGAGTTEVTLVDKQQPVFTFTLPVAGRHITNDLSVGLGISFDEAEQLKIQYGVASEDIADPQKMVEFEGQKNAVSLRVVGEIIEARLQEIFMLVQQSILEAGRQIPPAVILAGGTALLPGLAKLLATRWETQVRIADPPRVEGAPVNFHNAAFVSIAAMSIYTAHLNIFAKKTEKGYFRGIFDKFSYYWRAFSGI